MDTNVVCASYTYVCRTKELFKVDGRGTRMGIEDSWLVKYTVLV